jgi:hypothetical protein
MKITSRPFQPGGPPIFGRNEVEVEVDGEKVDVRALESVTVRVDLRASVPQVIITFVPPVGSTIEVDAAAADVQRRQP